jgi:hypothetical protein
VAEADLLETMRCMTPEQKLNAYLEHCQLVMEVVERLVKDGTSRRSSADWPGPLLLTACITHLIVKRKQRPAN